MVQGRGDKCVSLPSPFLRHGYLYRLRELGECHLRQVSREEGVYTNCVFVLQVYQVEIHVYTSFVSFGVDLNSANRAASVAQSVEHWPITRKVIGSSHTQTSKALRNVRWGVCYVLFHSSVFLKCLSLSCVDIKRSSYLHRVVPLPSSLADGLFYGYRCCLVGLHPPGKFANVAPPSWSANAITRFANMVDDNNDVVMKVGCDWY